MLIVRLKKKGEDSRTIRAKEVRLDFSGDPNPLRITHLNGFREHFLRSDIAQDYIHIEAVEDDE